VTRGSRKQFFRLRGLTAKVLSTPRAIGATLTG
jgi:hypothetical protein